MKQLVNLFCISQGIYVQDLSLNCLLPLVVVGGSYLSQMPTTRFTLLGRSSWSFLMTSLLNLFVSTPIYLKLIPFVRRRRLLLVLRIVRRAEV